ncbi:DgyrCDS9621 [Dimorphilus gyrociliatus]|uniref:DgyrCDS9621 n=1 Tax=Dimorphilus gyrociliatus TaxID=2664684 RepID=A0A7I8VXI7_9ANNE|nr:DgyrCDS9621 [Dimorphilus gyrociliatus]
MDLMEVTSTTTKPKISVLKLTPAVIAVCVLAGLCLILGVIYAYIYYTRLRPKSTKIRKFYLDCAGEDEGNMTTSSATHTHLFLFKK